MRLAQIALVAPIGAVRKRLPDGLVPLRPAPGIDLVVIVFYSYDVCDVDPYQEATVAIAVRPPRHGGPAELDFMQSRRNNTVYGHSLALPISRPVPLVGAFGVASSSGGARPASSTPDTSPPR